MPQLPKNIHQRLLRIALSGTVLFWSYGFSAAQAVPVPDADTLVREEEVIDESGNGEKPERFRDKAATDSFRVSERTLPAGYADKLKKDKNFWYADADLQKEEIKEKNDDKQYVPLGRRTWVQTLLWILIIGGFAGAIMWYLAESNVGLFRKKKSPGPGSQFPDEMPEDIFSINYQQEIDKATAQGNYRVAVRLMYLRLLKELSDRHIIKYKQDKTNLDYLVQLHSTPYYRPFFRLTRHFEYSWYGHFEVEEGAYRVIAGEFNNLEHEISQH